MAPSDSGAGTHAAEIAALRARIAELEAELAAPAGPLVSPLAPASFPDLPVIDGVRFATTEAGVRYAGREDVMLCHLVAGSTLAGVFTKSSTRAAPVLDCQEKLAVGLSSDAPSAILVNAGNANAFTGTNGVNAVKAITEAVAKTLDLPEGNVLTSSTGVIGEPLPHDRITDALVTLRGGLSETRISDAALAIMTTDTFPKGASVEIMIDGKPVRIAGIAKGSGMIAPDMATMLVYVFTDAPVRANVLQKFLSSLTDETFNAITVDSDTSTSDTLLLAATGQADIPLIEQTDSEAGRAFAAGLGDVMLNLAKQVVRDGEGATKLIEVVVTGAASAEDARKVASAIANSPLVKTAAAGEDPNWGRVVMAVGKSGAQADRDRLQITFGDILVAQKGWVAPSYREEDGAAYMRQPELRIGVDLGLGDGTATMWTCDLTKRYIEINADYRS